MHAGFNISKLHIHLAVLHQGVLGIKVKIMLDWDPKGKQGLTPALPDPSTPQKEEDEYMRPSLLVNDIDIAA
ncbi:hypothetical protein AAC387_Pa02g5165 [Persea americana]